MSNLTGLQAAVAASIPRHKQAFLHKPDDGQVGDCYRTCVACLLGIERDEAPHEHRIDDNYSQVEAMREWLLQRGYSLTLMPFHATPDEVLATMNRFAPTTPYIMTAKSRTDVGHCVICVGDEIVHDPSLTGSGIVGPLEDGYTWVEIISPLPAGVITGKAAA